jgi:hypothetical protein
LGDSVVFTFTKGDVGALLFLEWQLRSAQLPDGASSVFWIGADGLRSTLLLNQVSNQSVRNLYVTDPYTLGDVAGPFFVDMFKRRWAREPDQYAGNVFDAALMLVAANERAGLFRARGGTLSPRPSQVSLLPNAGADLKNSLQPITFGCIDNNLADLFHGTCPGTQLTDVTQRSAQDFSLAIDALHNGKEVAIGGVTGTLILSPAGDRLASIGIWKIASAGPTKGFFEVSRVDPTSAGVLWEK